MRTVTLYRHGLTMGTPPKMPPKSPAKRGEVNGWSESATRRNTAFLRSVNDEQLPFTLDGEPLTALALTLTVKDCPESHRDWESIRNKFFKRLIRLGLYRCHWVTEWQRRGVPHLHGAFWFPDLGYWDNWERLKKILSHWLELTAPYGSTHAGQHFNGIYDTVGWFKYLAKHASRGVKHYQRSGDCMPAGWRSTGRMWGKTGDWPLIEKEKLTLTDSQFFAMRRLAKRWRLADARKQNNRFRIRSARRMLKHNDKDLSKLRGVSEWMPNEIGLTLALFCKSTYTELPQHEPES